MASEDVLTEGEIDALMETVEEGVDARDPSDDGQYRRFDFAAREQTVLREFTALSSLMERQAELLTRAFDDAFSIEFEVHAQPAALLSVGDVLASLERVVAVTTTRLNPLHGPAFVVCPATFLSYVLNAYFGGGTTPGTAEREALTPTEMRIAERLSKLQLATLTGAWQDKLPLQSVDETTLGTPDRLEMLPRTDMLLRLAFEFTAGDFTGKLFSLIPFSELEIYRSHFAPPVRETDVDASESWEPHFRRELPDMELELAAVLGDHPITLAELLELREGSVLPMAAPERVILKADGVTLAEGRYGSFNGRKAVQLHRLGPQESRKRSGENT